MNAPSADPKTAPYWLTQAGWTYRGGDPGKWGRKAGKGSPALTCRDVSSDWQAWDLTGAAISCATKQRLAVNASLPALCKFTDLPDGSPGCRFDLPIELLRNTQEADPAQGISSPGPLQAWAQAVTAAATGRPAKKTKLASLSSEELVQWLENHGWPSSTENEIVLVNVPLPGLFCQIAVDSGCPLGTRLWCQLVEMSSWSDVCRDAARAFATVANQRLRLVRLASVAGASGELLQAEIIVPTTQIPGVWLEVALESLHVAIRLTARELAALRDPELAKLTLAAMSA